MKRDGMVQGFAMGQDGHLKPLPFASVQAAPPPISTDEESGTSVTAHPILPFLYVSTYRIIPRRTAQSSHNHACISVVDPSAVPTYASTLRPFHISTSGQLTALAPVAVPKNEAVHAIVLDPKGHFLYALVEGGKTLIYRIGKDGTPTPGGRTQLLGTFSTNFTADGEILGGASDDCILVFDPNGKFATLAFNTGGIDERWFYVRRYRIGTNGKMRTIQQQPSISGATQGIDITPDSKFVYLAGYRFTEKPMAHNTVYTDYSGIRQYRMTKKGMLAPLQPLTIGKNQDFTHVDPQGRFLYADAGQGSIEIYSIGKAGRLSLVLHTAHDSFPPDMMPDPFGRFLYGIKQGGKQSNYTYALVGCAVRTNGFLGPIFTLQVSGEPQSLVFVQR